MALVVLDVDNYRFFLFLLSWYTCNGLVRNNSGNYVFWIITAGKAKLNYRTEVFVQNYTNSEEKETIFVTHHQLHFCFVVMDEMRDWTWRDLVMQFILMEITQSRT